MTGREIEMAIDMCNDILTHLENAHGYLASARRWGIFDILGGQLLATAGKHEQMARAQKELKLATEGFYSLRRNIKYYENLQEFNVGANDMNIAFDYLFDNPITDIMTQNRIKKTTKSVEDAIAQMHVIIEDLYLQESEIAEDIEKKIEEMRQTGQR